MTQLLFLQIILSYLQLTKGQSVNVCLWFILGWGFGKPQSVSKLVSSFLLALVPPQSLLTQSDSWGEGCRAPCSQQEHDSPNLVHTLIGTGASMFVSMVSRSDTFAYGVLGLLVFIGLNLFLPNHLVLILPVVLFLGFLGVLGGAEN